MIVGVVNIRLEATIHLQILGPSGQMAVTATVDTGYNGYLSLPIAVARALSLPPLPPWYVRLGDRSRKLLNYYEARVDWDGQDRTIRALCVEGEPLIGTALLKGSKMEADFVAGGPVIISPLP